jgi:hypothetical protein
MLLDDSVLSETQTSADPFGDVLPDPKVCKSFFPSARSFSLASVEFGCLPWLQFDFAGVNFSRRNGRPFNVLNGRMPSIRIGL